MLKVHVREGCVYRLGSTVLGIILEDAGDDPARAALDRGLPLGRKCDVNLR